MIKNLKELRIQKGISQQKLADVIGISQQSINKYENHNIEPDIATLILIANYFSTSIDYLVGNTDINHIIEKVEAYELNTDEADFITDYRKLTHNEKESLKIIVRNYLNKN